MTRWKDQITEFTWSFSREYIHNNLIILHLLHNTCIWGYSQLNCSPVISIHWVRGPVLCLCLKVVQLLSANHKATKTLLIPQFLFAACLSHTVTMTTQRGDVGRQWFRKHIIWAEWGSSCNVSFIQPQPLRSQSTSWEPNIRIAIEEGSFTSLRAWCDIDTYAWGFILNIIIFECQLQISVTQYTVRNVR